MGLIVYGKVRRPESDGKTGLYIRGHAGYAKRGDDIVCAAVSAIGQTAAMGCASYELATEIKHCQKGHILFVCPSTAETDAIVIAALLGLDGVREKYPQCFAGV